MLLDPQLPQTEVVLLFVLLLLFAEVVVVVGQEVFPKATDAVDDVDCGFVVAEVEEVGHPALKLIAVFAEVEVVDVVVLVEVGQPEDAKPVLLDDEVVVVVAAAAPQGEAPDVVVCCCSC